MRRRRRSAWGRAPRVEYDIDVSVKWCGNRFMTSASALSDICVSFAPGAATGPLCDPSDTPWNKFRHRRAQCAWRLPAHSPARRPRFPVRRVTPATMASACGAARRTGPQPGLTKHPRPNLPGLSVKWLAKDGPRHYPLLAVEVRAARVVMSGPLPGPVCRRSLASSATSVSHDDDVIVCKSRLAVKE